MLQLRNITKTYRTGSNSVVALDNVSIDFPDKGLVFVVGKSGSGKSTLLNILGGLDKMDKGEIVINGKSTKDFSSSDFDAYRNYHIGFIFQEFNLIDDLSVKENIALALKIQSKGHDETTIDEALKLVNLEGLGYRSPRELSGGQKQRIAVARALVKNPNIILADEPTGALDSKTGYDLMSSLKTLSTDKLVIVVTHDAEMANVFGDEIIQLTDGHILDHLVISKNYKKEANELISKNILKIASGNEIQDKQKIDSLLSENETNYVCLISQPELLTIAYPEAYDKVFKKEDLSKKFVSKGDNSLKEIEEVKDKSPNQKAKIKLKECFNMAFNQFKANKGKLAFLIVFTIVAFSLLGFSSLFFTINNADIIANTLHKNNLNIGIMEKFDGEQRVLFDDKTLGELNTLNENANYTLSKQIDLKYKPSSKQTNSPFEMKYFRGIVECNNASELNLNMVEGLGSFDDNSLANHEIIISDYAAFELCRTGYLGLNANGDYGINHPDSIKDVVNTSVMINLTHYKIIGVFETNYEDFLPLLISEGYIDNKDNQISSLNSLKSYYYARVFGPKGFYSKYLEENKSDLPTAYFKVTAEKIPVYDYNSSEGTVLDSMNYKSFSATKDDKFYVFDDVMKEVGSKYDVIWSKSEDGTIPNKLKENQLVLSYSWIRESLYEPELIQKAIASFNSNIKVIKMKNYNDEDYPVQVGGFEVVGVIDIDDSLYYEGKNCSEIHMFFAPSNVEKYMNTINTFEQILFTLNNGVSRNSNDIDRLFKNNYRVLNIDGRVPTDSLDLESFKTVALMASIVVFIFATLFTFNYVSGNIKKRKKEIGILRATGARGIDVLKIFAIEQGIIALIVSLFSILIIIYGMNLANGQLGNVDIGINIISLSFVHVAIFVLFTVLFFVITTIIPVRSIAKMKPIEAIRTI